MTPVRTVGHQKQCGARRVRSLSEQVGLHQPGVVDFQWYPLFLVALADDTDPAAADVDVPDRKAKHLGRPQPGEQHQPGDRPVPVGAETAWRRSGFRSVQAAGQSSGSRTRSRDRDFGRSRCANNPPALLRRTRPACRRRPRHRVDQGRIPHRPEVEHTRDRRHPPVDRRRGIPAARPVRNGTTFPPVCPGSTAERQNVRNRSSASVVTKPTVRCSSTNHRVNANRSKAYARSVRGEYLRSATYPRNSLTNPRSAGPSPSTHHWPPR